MKRNALYVALLVALGAVAGVFLGSRGDLGGAADPAPAPARLSASAPARAAAPRAAAERDPAELERRLDRLAAKLTAETNERHRLEERLEELSAQLAALGAPGGDAASSAAGDASAASPAVAAAPPQPAAESGSTTLENALVAAGVDAATAADIKRRRDNLMLSEMYLRDQATREGWLDSPRFQEEMAEIEQQRTSVREEIGDEHYDRYLAALGEPNRVTVDEVMSDSPAAQAGLQAGDVVLRYGDTRIFAPGELVAETRAGTAGETIRLGIVRGGQLIEVDVPRGPLGLRIAAGHADPGGS